MSDTIEGLQATARNAYRRFMASAALLRRRDLSVTELHKARAIHLEAFGALTSSLTHLRETGELPRPDCEKMTSYVPAPKYSVDFRRNRPR